MRDPITRSIPSEAFVWPETHHLNIGALSLTTDDDFMAAEEFLRKLNLWNLLPGAPSSTKGPKPFKLDLTRGGALPYRPIKISLIGLEHPGKHMRNCISMRAQAVEEEKVLTHFITEIKQTLQDAKLLKLRPDERADSSLPLRSKILDSSRMYTTEVNPYASQFTPPGKDIYYTLQMDLAEVYSKYKDFVWARDIKLEKMSIWEMGLKKFQRGRLQIGQGHREIASVPLPGAPIIGSDSEIRDVTYEPVRKIYGVDPEAVYNVAAR